MTQQAGLKTVQVRMAGLIPQDGQVHLTVAEAPAVAIPAAVPAVAAAAAGNELTKRCTVRTSFLFLFQMNFLKRRKKTGKL